MKQVIYLVKLTETNEIIAAYSSRQEAELRVAAELKVDDLYLENWAKYKAGYMSPFYVSRHTIIKS